MKEKRWISRRDFVGTTAATLGFASAAQAAQEQRAIKPELSRAVQMQFLRPGQLEKALRAFPAVYVPFGLIEWHGRHLPLGNDALKAHGILVKTAEQFIEGIASRSSTTGHPYFVKLPSGEQVETGPWLRQRLAEIDSRR